MNLSVAQRQALHCTVETNSTQLRFNRITVFFSLIDEVFLLKTITSIQKFNFQPSGSIELFVTLSLFYFYRIPIRFPLQPPAGHRVPGFPILLKLKHK